MYSWHTIKKYIEKNEKEKVEDKVTDLEIEKNIGKKYTFMNVHSTVYFETAGAILVGINAALFTVIFNFILFVWILHFEF